MRFVCMAIVDQLIAHIHSPAKSASRSLEFYCEKEGYLSATILITSVKKMLESNTARAILMAAAVLIGFSTPPHLIENTLSNCFLGK